MQDCFVIHDVPSFQFSGITFKWFTTGANLISITDCTDVNLSNVVITGDFVNGYSVSVARSQNVWISNVNFSNPSSNSLSVLDSSNISVSNCLFANSLAESIMIGTVSNMLIDSTIFQNNFPNQGTGAVVSVAMNTTNLVISNSQFLSTRGHSIMLATSSQSIIQNCTFLNGFLPTDSSSPNIDSQKVKP